MTFREVFERRVRGFRVVELISVGLLATTVLGVYLAKAFATRERGEIGQVEDQLASENERMRLLKAEVAYLEQPDRLRRLARGLNLAVADASRQVEPDALAQVSAAGSAQ
jgi:hypothetical protein